MKKYYTRACNFYFGIISKQLVKKKLSIPLHGDNSISFDKIEIFLRNKNKITSKIIDLKKIKFLPSVIKKQINSDIKKLPLRKNSLIIQK